MLMVRSFCGLHEGELMLMMHGFVGTRCYTEEARC